MPTVADVPPTAVEPSAPEFNEFPFCIISAVDQRRLGILNAVCLPRLGDPGARSEQRSLVFRYPERYPERFRRARAQAAKRLSDCSGL